MNTDLKSLKHRSSTVTDGLGRAAARSYLRSVGLSDEDLHNKPLVAIANTWTDAMPCNAHLQRLAAKIKEGVRAACRSNATPLRFPTAFPWGRKA